MPDSKVAGPARRGRLLVTALLLASLVGYAALAVWFPLAPHLTRVPAADVRKLAPTLLGGLAYGLLILVLFLLFLAACRAIAARRLGSRPLLAVMGVSFVLALPLLWAYPINATDLFGYVVRGRVSSAYGQSPYSTPADAFPDDPFKRLIGEWAFETTPYGPLWEIIASGLTAVSGDNLLLGVLLFKALALACFLATAALIWSLLPPASRLAHTALWAWNPCLLLLFVMDGHNDAFMIFWLVLGYWVARRGRPAMGFLVMVLAVLTKMIAVLALPFFFLAFLCSIPTNRRRIRFTALAVVGALALTWLAFLPWAGVEEALWTPFYLVLRLVREATDGAGFSPAAWVYMVLGGRVSINTIGAATQALFAAFVLWLVWRALRGRSPLRGAADVLLGYVAGALNYRIWYATWPFPWLLLDGGGAEGEAGRASAAYRLRVGLWFLLTSQLSVVLYGHVRVFALGGDQMITHLFVVPFVFGLPWLLALIPIHFSAPLTPPS